MSKSLGKRDAFSLFTVPNTFVVKDRFFSRSSFMLETFKLSRRI